MPHVAVWPGRFSWCAVSLKGCLISRELELETSAAILRQFEKPKVIIYLPENVFLLLKGFQMHYKMCFLYA